MTTYSSTVSNTIDLFGGSPTYKWDVSQWDNFKYYSASEDLITIFYKSIFDNLNCDDNLIRDLIKRFAETITIDDFFVQKIYKLLSENITINDDIEKQIVKILSENTSIQDLEILYKQRGYWFEKAGDFRDLAKTWEQNWTEVD